MVIKEMLMKEITSLCMYNPHYPTYFWDSKKSSPKNSNLSIGPTIFLPQ